MNTKRNDSQMRSGKILMGVLSGAAAGAVLGVLFAPKKGADMRRKISDTSNAYADQTKTRFNEMVGSVSSKYDTLKAKATRKTRKMESEVEGEEKIVY